MLYDPNSVIPTAFEARVRARGVRLTPDGSPVQVSTRSDFIAPELSAPSTLAIELDKGMRGWSDYDVKVPSAKDSHAESVKAAQLEAMTVGESVIRKAPVSMAVRPLSNGAAHRAAARAAKRARYSK